MEKVNTLVEKQDKLELRDYQVEDLAFYIRNPRCANLSDPGTGKTPSTVVYGQYLWEYKNSKIAWPQPKSLLEKNRDEILEFTDFTEDDIVIVDGTPKQRERQLADKNGKFFLMGYKRFSDDWQTLKEIHPDVNAVFVDEMHLGYAGHNSKRTQALYKAMKHHEYFLPMTGTLIKGRLDTAYPTIHLINPYYYASFGQFRGFHGEYDFFGNLIGWKNHWKLGEIFKKHCVRRSFEDLFGKQEEVVIVRKCEMSPKQREAYTKLETEALIELEDEFIEAGLPGVNAIRARQIMACPEIFQIHGEDDLTGKDEQLIIDLEDHKRNGEPLVIFAVFDKEIRRIVDVVRKEGLRVDMINGTVPSPKRSQIDRDFRDGKLDVVVASADTAGIGYNWAHVNHVVFHSLSYGDDSYNQAKRRAIRGKRTRPLQISIYEYRKSIDQRIFSVVESKNRNQRLVDDSYEEIRIREPDVVREGGFGIGDF